MDRLCGLVIRLEFAAFTRWVSVELGLRILHILYAFLISPGSTAKVNALAHRLHLGRRAFLWLKGEDMQNLNPRSYVGQHASYIIEASAVYLVWLWFPEYQIARDGVIQARWQRPSDDGHPCEDMAINAAVELAKEEIAAESVESVSPGSPTLPMRLLHSAMQGNVSTPPGSRNLDLSQAR